MASPLATSFAVCFAFTENPILRGADMPVCSMQMVSTKSYGAAATCRPDMPHTLRSPPGEIPQSCPRRRLRRLAPSGAAGTLWKPCAPGLPCGFAVLTPARIVVVDFALAATASAFMPTQGLASATGTRALPPRDPGFPSFRAKRRKTRKATAINRISQITSIKAIQILRHKPPPQGDIMPEAFAVLPPKI